MATFIGSADPDSLTGSATDDAISGLDGNDTLLGLSGNDTIAGDLGNDSLDGGDGFDLASYATALAAVNVNLGVSTAQATGGGGTDILASIEGLEGSGFNDTLTGNEGANLLAGMEGNDLLVGGGASDVYKFDLGGGADTVQESGVAGPPPGPGDADPHGAVCVVVDAERPSTRAVQRQLVALGVEEDRHKRCARLRLPGSTPAEEVLPAVCQGLGAPLSSPP